MRILGLDLSLTSTGYCLRDEDHVAWFGTVSGGNLRDTERLMFFDRWIHGGSRERH